MSYYWPDEKPFYDQAKLETINDVCAIDTVITHTAPSFCELTSKHGIQEWLVRDEDLLVDIKDERRIMDDIQAYLYAHNHPVRQWYYSHFHESRHREIEGVTYNMLDCIELREIQ